MAGVRGAARNAKVDLKSNAREVIAWTREMGALTPAALTTSVVNIVLKGLQQAYESGLVQGYENPSKKSGSWYEIPVPGADHRMSAPTLYDMRSASASIVYKRDEKGHILDREATQFGPMRAYLFRDKWVSRTGNLRDLLYMDWGEQHVDETQWKVSGTHESILLQGADGISIAGRDGVALIQTTPDKWGYKIAALERARADRGNLQPRYVIRRNLQSVSRRWSTTFKSEMKRAEKLADKAAQRARSKE